MPKKFLLLFGLIGLIFFVNIKNSQAVEVHLVINEILIGQAGVGNSNNEFIELYNPTDQEIDLSDYSLKKNTLNKKTKPGVKETESSLVSSAKFNGKKIAGKGYFLIAQPDYVLIVGVDLPYSNTTNSIADNNTIILYNPAGEIVDLVGYGEATVFETAVAVAPVVGQSLERKNLGVDTDNNSVDFIINNNPTPKSFTQVVIEPVVDDNEKTIDNAPVDYQANDLVINEFVFNPLEGEKEWIEIFSNFDKTTDLTGWTIEDATGKAIIDLSGDLISNGWIVFELNSSKLNNDGDTIILKDVNKKIIDQVIYGSTDGAPLAKKGESVSRKIDGADTGSDQVDFVIITSSKGLANSKIKTADKTSSGTKTQRPVVAIGSVVFSEIVADPADGPEWLEIYNKNNQSVDLTDWSIEDGSEEKTKLSGVLKGGSYLVIENPAGNLNNSGDMITLYDHRHQVIDQVTYGGWQDDNIKDNAPKAVDPFSLSRIDNNQDTNNDLADWQISQTLTPNASNILFVETTEIKSDLKNKIIISEIFPNPVGSDESEFVELQNISEQAIDLSGLIIGDNSSRRYEIPVGSVVSAGKFLVIKRLQSQMALNNTGGDKVILFDQDKKIIDEIEYKDKAEEGRSYAVVNNKWQWTDQVTPNENNIFIQEDQAPVISLDINKSELEIGEELILDASDSYDPEGQDLIFEWQLDKQLFHDKIWKLFFNKLGDYKIKLIISDGNNKSVKEILIRVLNSVEGSTSNLEVEPSVLADSLNLINEFLPNPDGSDSEEFIELFNVSGQAIDLSNFFLDDEDGGSQPYQIEAGTVLEAGSYLVFDKAQTKLALNNDGDTVRLLDSQHQVLQAVKYDKAIAGASYSKTLDNYWSWSDATPKQINQIISADDFVNTEAIITDLKILTDLDLGSSLFISGVVTVEPGILGSQFFYVSDGKSGMQIYNSKKDFPELKIGDKLEINGVLSKSGEEYRLKIKNREDIKIVGHQDSVEPISISAKDLGDDLVGALVKIDGEIIEMKGQNIFLENNDDEANIYLKKTAKVSKTTLKEGDIISVVGILNHTNTGYRILPRAQSDIDKVQVLGVEINTEGDQKDFVIKPRDNEWLKYVAVTLGAVVIVLGVLLVRVFKKKD